MKPLSILLLAFLLLPFVPKAQTAPQTSRAARPLHTRKRDSLVRGVSFDAFKNSVNDFLDTAKKLLLDTSWTLWKAEKWGALEKFFTAGNLNGGWPPNSGAVSLRIVTLDSGLLVDRYGGYYVADSLHHDSVFQDKGKFVCFKGVPFPKRALPQSTLKSPYRLYRIIKAIANIKRGPIIPWFSEPGLGIQFEMPVTIDELKQGGYIVEISSTAPN